MRRLSNMIIVFSDTEINHKAVDALLAKQPQQIGFLKDISFETPLVMAPSDKTLTILDLNANGHLQKLYSPTIMVQQLDKIGLLAQVDTIQFLVSDVVASHSMSAFATAICRALIRQKPEATLSVRVPADFLTYSLILPPNHPDGDWAFYSCKSIPELESPAEKQAIEFYQSKMNQVFEGPIEALLLNPNYGYSLQETKEIYGIDGDRNFDQKLNTIL